MNQVTLPAWLLAELPEVRPHGRAEADGDSAVVYVAPDGQRTSFEDVPAAFRALRETDLEFSDELAAREGARGRMISFPSGRAGFRTAWLASNDALHLAQLGQQYRDSLAWAADYHGGGTDDFLAAFRYIDTHPAFWIRRKGDSEHARWFWETAGHMNRVYVSAEPDDEVGVVVELETGMHTPDMTEHYHDFYLDADGRTFEEAVVALARNVAVSFRDDGTETGSKPPNPWADELIATVTERMRDIPADEGAE